MCSRATPTVISAMRRAASEWSGAQDEVIKTTKYYLMLSTNCSATCRAIHWPPLDLFFWKDAFGDVILLQKHQEKTKKYKPTFQTMPKEWFWACFLETYKDTIWTSWGGVSKRGNFANMGHPFYNDTSAVCEDGRILFASQLSVLGQFRRLACFWGKFEPVILWYVPCFWYPSSKPNKTIDVAGLPSKGCGLIKIAHTILNTLRRN